MSQCTILVIDDEPFLRLSLGKILEKVGYNHDEAGNGAEALQKAACKNYNLIFLDIMLPDSTGIDLLPVLSRLQPRVPVVVLSADGSLEKVAEAMRQGAYDYLLKPIDPGQIITHVDDILHLPGEQLDSYPEVVPAGEWLDYEREPQISVLKQSPTLSRQVVHGELAVNLNYHTVHIRGKLVSLPICTFEYLVTLLQHSPHPVGYRDLVGESQGYWLSALDAKDLARWRIYRLRKAIEDNPNDPRWILSVPGVGYKLVEG